MSGTGQELEIKFYLSKPKRLKDRLAEVGARCIQERVYEINIRYDTPDQALRNTGRLLRLRKDTLARLTYKGPGEISGGARLREELEFTVSDFSTAQAFLLALGYQVVMIYEKYRTTYSLENVLVMIDEMPYGNFAEIEGPDGESIQAATQHLGLDWEARSLESYTQIFDTVRLIKGLPMRDLSFANFKEVRVLPGQLGVSKAD